MDLNLIKQRLEQLNATGQKTSFNEGDSIFWKPEPGQNLIRILPNPYNRDYAFTELLFYYDFGKTMISPKSFGQADVVFDFAQKMRRSKDELERKVAYRLEPKMRTYAMVLIRGKESEGPKYWAFGKTVYAELLGVIADPDYGDITDLVSGRDVVVDFTPAKTAGEFPKTTIRVKPNTSKAFDDPALVEKIKAIKALNDIWPVPTESELKDALEKYLKGESSTPAETPKADPAAKKAAVREEPSDEDFDVSKLKVPTPPKEEPTEPGLKATVLDEIDEMFAEFEKKK